MEAARTPRTQIERLSVTEGVGSKPRKLDARGSSKICSKICSKSCRGDPSFRQQAAAVTNANGVARSRVPVALAFLAPLFCASFCQQLPECGSNYAAGERPGVAEQMHGDYHPPVTITLPHNALSRVSAAGSVLLDIKLRLTVNGCVPGFEYQLMAALVSHCGDDTAVLKTWERIFVGTSSGNLDLNATFASPAKCERCRFKVVLFDLYANLSLDERKLAGREVELEPQVEVIDPSVLPMHERLLEADRVAAAGKEEKEEAAEESGIERLFGSSPAPVGSIRAFHRVQLCRHFALMRQLEEHALWIPALWWFRRPSAYAFYHPYITHLLRPEFQGWQGGFKPWREDPPIAGLRRFEYTNTRPNAWRWVLEDLHVGGRGLAGDEAHPANEVFVSEVYKVAYVVARKCASTAISQFLAKHLNASVHWCDRDRCPMIFDRCTSMCLNSHDLLGRRYLIFSFVQHPVRRFFKALTTLLSKAALESESADAVALQVLSLLQEKSHAVEHHLETLSFSLSSETAEKTMPQLELDFVGRVETIDKDWQELISLANARSNVPKIEFAPLPVKRRELVVNETQKRALWTRIMTPQVISLAHETYAQDIVSFGYGEERASPLSRVKVCCFRAKSLSQHSVLAVSGRNNQTPPLRREVGKNTFW